MSFSNELENINKEAIQKLDKMKAKVLAKDRDLKAMGLEMERMKAD